MSNYDPTDLRGQAKKQEDAENRERLVREVEIADIKWLMSSRRGRRIMWRLLELAGPFRLSFDMNAMKMAFNEGQRNLGNQLFNEVMTHCPEQYPAMVKEQQDGKRERNGDQPN